MANKDGGPAFPNGPGSKIATNGMSLRDWFAGKALLGEIITSCSDATPESAEALADAARENGQTVEERLAFNAYRLADAMLAERLNG
jgi:hypothetical protein